LEPELEISTEDGYSGVLALDYTTIAVEAAGYKTSSRTVSATRTYPNLSDADVSLNPKSVEENGRALTLANVDWQEAAADHADGYTLALRYNAVATYTGTATSKYATGYTVTAEYKGEITKTSCDTIIYTAIFSSIDAVEVAEEDTGNTAEVNWPLILIPLSVVGLSAAGYFGRKGYIHYQNKKKSRDQSNLRKPLRRKSSQHEHRRGISDPGSIPRKSGKGRDHYGQRNRGGISGRC